MKDLFLLSPDVIFLNHGSFGACPRPVMARLHALQAEMEAEPVILLDRIAIERMAESRAALGAYLNVPGDDVVYFPNPTTAINMVMRSMLNAPPGSRLHLAPGDEILTSDHEYGAMTRTWRYFCRHSGARLVQREMPLPMSTPEAFAARFWDGVTARTRVIFLSHITSQTALIFPVEEIVRRARQAGILCILDGAHAPAQIPLDLGALQPDVYTGALHKWLCAPKGTAFLYARPEIQALLDPLVVSWGYESEQPGPSRFVDYHEWQGTRDITPFLTVPTAIAFQQAHDWAAVRADCHRLAVETRTRINALTGLESIAPPEWIGQMASVRLPAETDPAALQRWLWEEKRIEIPVFTWNGQPFLRVSFQAYNTPADADALVSALETWLAQAR
ncbi:MAG: aminotransferase class V-fold PLP-dependent enzyme [Anaerolineales bacterium]